MRAVRPIYNRLQTARLLHPSSTRLFTASRCSVALQQRKWQTSAARSPANLRASTTQRAHHSNAFVKTSVNAGETTIYALSTAPGRAAIAVIRISGPACVEVSLTQTLFGTRCISNIESFRYTTASAPPNLSPNPASPPSAPSPTPPNPLPQTPSSIPTHWCSTSPPPAPPQAKTSSSYTSTAVPQS